MGLACRQDRRRPPFRSNLPQWPTGRPPLVRARDKCGRDKPVVRGYGADVKKTLLLTIGAAAIVAGVMTGCQATRAGYDSAPYTVVRSEGRFQIRDYPPLRVAETSTPGAGTGADGGFRRLFGYITGGNQDHQKIAMTTPVFISPEKSGATMAFVMPAKLSTGPIPEPSDAAVQIRELPAGRFAVLRFSGGRSGEREAEALERLKGWMNVQGLGATATPVYGYFDPPWTPGFLRRNEVMLRVISKP
ncbi:MAG TPA: SOUL heme-binding protein [Verrucomicrobiales bacterium]|nr:SOUL heme-binding protein [Verrucomicrobiales bacterium]